MLKKFSYNYRSLFILFALVWFNCGVLMPGFVKAAPGDLDTTFGTAGTITDNTSNILVYKVVLQPDGKIIVIGRRRVPSYIPSYPPTDYLFVRRYTSTGSLDTTYWSLNKGVGHDAKVQPDGKLVVVGAAPNTFPILGGQILKTISPVVWRFNGDGGLDTSFGSNGRAFVNTIAEGGRYQVDVFDSRIVIGFASRTPNLVGASPTHRFARMSSVGNLEYTRSLSFYYSAGSRIAIDHLTGDVLAAGVINIVANGTQNAVLRRYTIDNIVVAGFGLNGEAEVPICTPFSPFIDHGPSDLEILLDGRIMVYGTYGLQAVNIAQMMPDGSAGTVCVGDAYPPAVGYELFIQPDGKFFYFSGVFASAVRYFPDGTFDSSFNNVGYHPSAIQPDQKIVAAWGENARLKIERRLLD